MVVSFRVGAWRADRVNINVVVAGIERLVGGREESFVEVDRDSQRAASSGRDVIGSISLRDAEVVVRRTRQKEAGD